MSAVGSSSRGRLRPPIRAATRIASRSRVFSPAKDVGLADPAAIERRDDAGRHVLDVDGRDPDVRQGHVAKAAVVGATDLLPGPRVVARTVRDAGHDDDDRGARIDALADRAMGEVLRLVVVVQEALGQVAPVALVDDPALRVPGDVDGRDVDEPLQAGGGDRVEDPVGHPDVGIEHGRAHRGRDADAVHPRDVDGGVGAAHRIDDRRGPRQVARPHLDPEVRQRRSPDRDRGRWP